MIIHHLWMQGFENSPLSPQEIEKLQWGNDSQHMYWDETTIVLLIQQHYPSWLPMFHKLPMTILKCDVARAFLLHYYGGCYADIDYIPSHTFAQVSRQIPLDRICLPRYFGIGKTMMPNNNIIMCAPGNDAWVQSYLPYVKNYLRTGGSWGDCYCSMLFPPWYVFAFTGPLALWRAIPTINILNEDTVIRLGQNPGFVSNWIQYDRSKRHFAIGGVLSLVFVWCLVTLCVKILRGLLIPHQVPWGKVYSLA
jgi:mannosyltransferase OCH1-like enzyme